ncbi:unnamed protein product [Ilex paraguariensis]|uniref:Telomere-associated protein Rif1 N-terminal domain-containing protein n=1 Tax=Ilex paraguariensis TaxID=185542 RepID=A0ABC8RGS2_9AQUA
MANFRDQLEEIKTLLSSNTKSHKPVAYSTLLHLQEQSSTDQSLIQSLAHSSHSLLSSILIDISADEEEIAAQALKCLGFMVYHPSIVAEIPGNDAKMIAGVLVKVITTTKIKSVCNLGVWCISIQQFNVLFLAEHIHSWLTAIVHALDNPIGSLSTTFEAMQAVMKLATQIGEKMRDLSNIWVPPVYRRLVSINKRERDMSERCLLKIRSTICPPTLILSKALVLDMKKKLLPSMKELLNRGLKIQTLQAWGWFTRLLGPYAMKYKHLINEMLKIPEQTFSDFDPQVQIASQAEYRGGFLVAWEGLIDTLIYSPIQAPKTNTAPEQSREQMGTCKGNDIENAADGFLKRIKLIMTPLIGIMSSKCDASVHLSCLNTWSYLLHKLGTSVNHPSVIKMVWDPIFKVVFQARPDIKNMGLWTFCLDLLDDYAAARSTDAHDYLNNQEGTQLSASSHALGSPVYGKCSWKHYPIKWLPWDLSQLDFFIKMIHILISKESMETVAPEIKEWARNACLRIFRSVLKGVQSNLKGSSITYDEVMLCLNTILRFTTKICEDETKDDCDNNYLLHISVQFVEAVTEELEPFILGSPLYKVALDLKHINDLGSDNELIQAEVPGLCFTAAYSDMVSPMVYLAILYSSLVDRSTLNAPEAESILLRMCRYVKFLLSSYDPSEILHVFITWLYNQMGCNCLKIWISLANSLKDYGDGVKDPAPFKIDSDNSSYLAVCHLLSYPLAVCSCPKKSFLFSSQSERKIELDHVIEVWKSLYVSINDALQCECFSSRNFSEDLSAMLNEYLDAYKRMLESGTELNLRENKHDLELLSLCGDLLICVMEQIPTPEASFKGIKGKDDGDHGKSSGVKNSLGLAARFMSLSYTNAKIDQQAGLAATVRVFSILLDFVGCLCLKEDILSFFEIFLSPLLQWLSYVEMKDENINHQLQLLWTGILECLRKSWPPIKFDSPFLQLLAPLLETTFDHPNPSISDPSIAFWNSTFSGQIKLDYPQSLLPVLDKLSRSGKINLCKRSALLSEKGNSRVDVIGLPHGYRVTTTQNRNSKRVEFVEDKVNGLPQNHKLSLCSKRKRPELTEHQKEVRRAQQGRAKDSNGHGPGIRTYTRVDFSQGNEESQDSQEIRDAESILEMLRRDGKLS